MAEVARPEPPKGQQGPDVILEKLDTGLPPVVDLAPQPDSQPPQAAVDWEALRGELDALNAREGFSLDAGEKLRMKTLEAQLAGRPPEEEKIEIEEAGLEDKLLEGLSEADRELVRELEEKEQPIVEVEEVTSTAEAEKLVEGFRPEAFPPDYPKVPPADRVKALMDVYGHNSSLALTLVRAELARVQERHAAFGKFETEEAAVYGKVKKERGGILRGVRDRLFGAIYEDSQGVMAAQEAQEAAVAERRAWREQRQEMFEAFGINGVDEQRFSAMHQMQQLFDAGEEVKLEDCRTLIAQAKITDRTGGEIDSVDELRESVTRAPGTDEKYRVYLAHEDANFDTRFKGKGRNYEVTFDDGTTRTVKIEGRASIEAKVKAARLKYHEARKKQEHVEGVLERLKAKGLTLEDQDQMFLDRIDELSDMTAFLAEGYTPENPEELAGRLAEIDDYRALKAAAEKVSTREDAPLSAAKTATDCQETIEAKFEDYQEIADPVRRLEASGLFTDAFATYDHFVEEKPPRTDLTPHQKFQIALVETLTGRQPTTPMLESVLVPAAKVTETKAATGDTGAPPREMDASVVAGYTVDQLHAMDEAGLAKIAAHLTTNQVAEMDPGRRAVIVDLLTEEQLAGLPAADETARKGVDAVIDTLQKHLYAILDRGGDATHITRAIETFVKKLNPTPETSVQMSAEASRRAVAEAKKLREADSNLKDKRIDTHPKTRAALKTTGIFIGLAALMALGGTKHGEGA